MDTSLQSFILRGLPANVNAGLGTRGVRFTLGPPLQKCRYFLDLWKDADSGLPEVENAKRKLAALQN
jgi:hypothetical protein